MARWLGGLALVMLLAGNPGCASTDHGGSETADMPPPVCPQLRAAKARCAQQQGEVEQAYAICEKDQAEGATFERCAEGGAACDAMGSCLADELTLHPLRAMSQAGGQPAVEAAKKCLHATLVKKASPHVTLTRKGIIDRGIMAADFGTLRAICTLPPAREICVKRLRRDILPTAKADDPLKIVAHCNDIRKNFQSFRQVHNTCGVAMLARGERLAKTTEPATKLEDLRCDTIEKLTLAAQARPLLEALKACRAKQAGFLVPIAQAAVKAAKKAKDETFPQECKRSLELTRVFKKVAPDHAAKLVKACVVDLGKALMKVDKKAKVKCGVGTSRLPVLLPWGQRLLTDMKAAKGVMTKIYKLCDSKPKPKGKAAAP